VHLNTTCRCASFLYTDVHGFAQQVRRRAFA
jgi:hypothetical protein